MLLSFGVEALVAADAQCFVRDDHPQVILDIVCFGLLLSYIVWAL